MAADRIGGGSGIRAAASPEKLNGFRSPRRRLRWCTVSAVVVITLLGACRGDGEDAAADKRRYCELARELSRRAEGAFMDLPADASPDQVTRAYEYFVSSSAAELDEIQRVAPAKVRDEVRSRIAAQRNAAGGVTEGLAATRRSGDVLRDYEDKECRPRPG